MRHSTILTLGSITAISLMSGATAKAASVFETVYSFQGNYSSGGPDGGGPGGHIVHKGSLIYGATAYGGNGGGSSGTLYSYNTTTGSEAPIFAFDNIPGGQGPYEVTAYSDYLVYETCCGGNAAGGGVVGQFNLATGKDSTLATFGLSNSDYFSPYGGVYYKGLIYGVGTAGGQYGCGGLFSINPKTGARTDLHDFSASGSEACDPAIDLVNVQGVLYGTSGSLSGANRIGDIFSYNIATKTFSVVYSFPIDPYGNAPNGSNPGQLIAASGVLYGAAVSGGPGAYPGSGTLFSFDPSTNSFNVLYSFTGTAKDGAHPTLHGFANGILYGQSYNSATGTDQIFKFNIKTGKINLLHTFTAAEGGGSDSGFVYIGGFFYGVTDGGGTNKAGTIFRFRP